MLEVTRDFIKRFKEKRSSSEVFSISSANPSRSVEQSFRKILYLFLMFSRVFLFLVIVLFYSVLPIFVVILFAVMAIFLPFFAMIFANSPKK